MAGGVAVVTASGAAVGGALGASTASAYLGTDKSFKIENLRDGTGPPVLLASGFLTEGESAWGSWRELIDQRYPDAPVYRVFWGSKELKALGTLATVGAGKAAATKAVVSMASHASRRAAGKVPYLGSLLVAKGMIANPWTVAKTRAAMTGAGLAALIAHT